MTIDRARWNFEVRVNTRSFFFSFPFLVEYPRSISRHFLLPASTVASIFYEFCSSFGNREREREKEGERQKRTEETWRYVRRAAIEKLEKSQIQMLRRWQDGGWRGRRYRPWRTEPPRRTKTSNTGSVAIRKIRNLLKHGPKCLPVEFIAIGEISFACKFSRIKVTFSTRFFSPVHS